MRPANGFSPATASLHYRPLPGEEIGQVQVIAPVVERFLLVQGDPAKENCSGRSRARLPRPVSTPRRLKRRRRPLIEAADADGAAPGD